MAKDIWQFTGVTYDNVLITVEEEIDRGLTRSDAERLCKSRNGLKEIRTSSPITKPQKIKRTSNNDQSAGDNQSAGIFIIQLFFIYILYAFYDAFFEYFIWLIGLYEGIAFSRFYLKKEINISNKFAQLLFYGGSIFFISFAFASFALIFEREVWYIKLIPIWYLIIRITIGRFFI